MKNLILLICTFNICFAQITFNDINFKNALLQTSPTSTNFFALDINMIPIAIDANNNLIIEYSEALSVYRLAITAANINDLTGIEFFTNLIWFTCAGNNLTNINLSQLIHLEVFGCVQNNLTNLDISNLINLKILNFQNNQISTLDFSNNPLLEKVFCNNNQLTSLNFSNNPLFSELDCYNNPNLTSVNIKNGATQLLGTQTYYNQCWVGLPNLTNVCVDGSEINAVANYLNGCGLDINAIDITKECVLGVIERRLYSNNLKIIKNNSELSFLSSQQEISSIKIYDLTGKLLVEKAVLAGFSANVALNIAPQLLLVRVGFNDGSTVNEKVGF